MYLKLFSFEKHTSTPRQPLNCCERSKGFIQAEQTDLIPAEILVPFEGLAKLQHGLAWLQHDPETRMLVLLRSTRQRKVHKMSICLRLYWNSSYELHGFDRDVVHCLGMFHRSS